MQGAAEKGGPPPFLAGAVELPRGSPSRSAPLTSQAWRPPLPGDPERSEPLSAPAHGQGSCAFKNTRVHPTRAALRGARAGGAGFVNGARAEGEGEAGGREGEGQRGGASPSHAAAELKSALPPPKVSRSLRSEAVGDWHSAPHSLQEVGRGRDPPSPQRPGVTTVSARAPIRLLPPPPPAQGLQQHSYPRRLPVPPGASRGAGVTPLPCFPASSHLTRSVGLGVGLVQMAFWPQNSCPPHVSFPPSSPRGEAKRGPRAPADPAALFGGH